ncbi:MAG: ABC transporter ATP-binding protein [Alphaproteobacteria bacterium]|nr:MAG: ABC transporter ATP-binding protein [Alphaproteobacteria bacterium]
MLLEIRDLKICYGRIQAIRHLDMHVRKGEITAVLGANGAGKSSLLRTILGIHSPAGGSIIWDGHDISSWPITRRIASGIVLVPEGRRILVEQTIHENLLLGATARRDVSNVADEISAIYERFPNLAARKDFSASCLSGGEQQMLAIGRALLAAPRLLMLDEPSLGLSPIAVSEVFRLFEDLNRKGLSLLLVEQNTGAALSIADRGYVLERGALVMHGTPSELLADQRLSEAYLGRENGVCAEA